MCFISFNPPQICEVGTLIMLIWQIQKVMQNEIKSTVLQIKNDLKIKI